MWLKLSGQERVSGAPERRIPPDDLKILRARVHLCTMAGNRIGFPVCFFTPVSLSKLQSRLSDLGAALSVSLEVTRHWNAPYYRHNRPVEATGHPWFSTIRTRLTTQYDLEIAPASCIKKAECFAISDRLRLTITGISRNTVELASIAAGTRSCGSSFPRSAWGRAFWTLCVR